MHTIFRLIMPALLGASVAACSTYSNARHKLDDFYQPVAGEKFPVEAVDLSVLNVKNLRQVVDYETDYPPGTIVINPRKHFLYLVQSGGTALRYGVGVGKAGFEFTGQAIVHHKREWPSWTPTPEMFERDPDRYRRFAGGMPGGPTNPLGARALYLFKDGKDTLFRIHGTVEPWSIGQASSSGCIRMINQDVIDLYNRVEVGTTVIVVPTDD